MHLLQATQDYEEDEISPNHLEQTKHWQTSPSEKWAVIKDIWQKLQGVAARWGDPAYTCIKVGTTPVLTTPKAALRTSMAARVWQKNITSDIVWNVSYRESGKKGSRESGRVHLDNIMNVNTN